MKILHISHSHEQSGWGDAIRNYQHAMINANLDVVSRPVLLGPKIQLEPRLAELEQKSVAGCDIVIQHILPRYMSYNGNFKNIGMVILETKGIKNSTWINNINLLDEVWLPNSNSILDNNGINIPQYLVPHACNIDEYKIGYQRLPGIENVFNFYFVGEFSRRKNLAATLKAFHLEFKHEPVNLILKLNKPGYTPSKLFNEVKQFCTKIKEGLKIHPDNTISEIVITERLSRQDLLRLHRSCDCYVNSSYGEAWEQSCFDAMAMGNKILSSDNGGPKDYLKEYPYKYLIDGHLEPVFAAQDTVPELYTGQEQWFSIDVNYLRMLMRQMYEEKIDTTSQRDAGLICADNYSYTKIGNLIKDTLNDSK